MNGFERRKEQKKESIQRAALELFRLYGFKKVSVNDIAVKAGVSPVTIYNHFGSKHDLVREIVKNQFLTMMERYREIIKGESTFLEKLETIIFDKTEIASQYHGELLQTVVQNYPDMQQFFQSFWQREVTQTTLDLLEDGKRQGYISLEQPQEALMLYLEILRRGVFASADLFEHMEPNAKLFRELNYLFIYGLIGKKE